MNIDLSIKNYIEIFPGAFYSQRHKWRRAAHMLPANSCLLVFDPKDEKQTRVMHKVAQSFRDRGQKVFIWMTPVRVDLAI